MSRAQTPLVFFSHPCLNCSEEIDSNDPLRAGLSLLTVVRWLMAKIIEFYVPSSFRKKATRWMPPEQCGKVIPFTFLEKKSA